MHAGRQRFDGMPDGQACPEQQQGHQRKALDRQAFGARWRLMAPQRAWVPRATRIMPGGQDRGKRRLPVADLAAPAARPAHRRGRARRTAGPGRSRSRPRAGSRTASTVSTPSATTCMPRLWPISMMVRTMVASLRSVVAVAHEGLVDLQRADRELLQRRQRGIAGAEIIDGQVQAQRRQFIEHADGALGIGHQRGFGDLQFQLLGRDAVAGEHGLAVEDEAGLAQLLQRQVQRDATRRAARPAASAR